MNFRPALDSDAAALIELSRLVLADSTTIHLLRPGETIETVEEQSDLIRWYCASANRRMLVAEGPSGEITGQAAAFGGTYTADQGTAVLVIEVAPAWRRQGIATRLLVEIEAWARMQGLHRLELTVLAENLPALKLYEKCGFAAEGRKKASRRVNHLFYDEIIMAKLLRDS
jgi:RimJ/RimL family protein N-acetyltransferase